jgi:TPR repeat protein
MRYGVMRLLACLVPAAGLAGCVLPDTYLGVSTRGPISADERAILDLSLAQGRLGTGDCEWWDRKADKLSRMPCEDLPGASLAINAYNDDQHSALELGRRLEEGRGMPQDLDKAESFYELAASNLSETLGTYMDGQWHTAYILGPSGLPEAQRRLELLRAWRAQRDDPALAQCPAPAPALADLAAQPADPEEAARLAAALAEGQIGRGQCPWRGEDQSLTTIPCDALPLPQLAGLAASGDHRAALELGIRFERGRGTARNRAQAEALYCAAGRARITGGPGAHGWTLLDGEPGLAEARRRLQQLREPRSARGG